MKKFSIADSVFRVNLKYAKLQNQSKELFFRCLDEERPVEYFKAHLEEIWNIDDITYLKEQIFDYEAELHKIHKVYLLCLHTKNILYLKTS